MATPQRKISSWELAAPGQQSFEHIDGEREEDDDDYLPELNSGRPLIRFYESQEPADTIEDGDSADGESIPLISQSKSGGECVCVSLMCFFDVWSISFMKSILCIAHLDGC